MNSAPSTPPTVSTPQSVPSVSSVSWDTVRRSLDCVRAAGRAYLFGQAWLGWQLATLKKAFSVREGRPSKNSANLAEFRAWEEIIHQETGLSRRTADRFIALFEATQAKLKRAKKVAGTPSAAALALFQSETPLALPPEQREHLQTIISTLTDGETQGSLMAELGIIPKPVGPPKGPKQRREETLTPQQLAFDFFEGPAHSIMNTRASRDYHTLLHCLPVTTTEEGRVSLILLRDETAAMLADIQAAISKHQS